MFAFENARLTRGFVDFKALARRMRSLWTNCQYAVFVAGYVRKDRLASMLGRWSFGVKMFFVKLAYAWMVSIHLFRLSLQSKIPSQKKQ